MNFLFFQKKGIEYRQSLWTLWIVSGATVQVDNETLDAKARRLQSMTIRAQIHALVTHPGFALFQSRLKRKALTLF